MTATILRKSPCRVGAVIPIHEPDAVLWLDGLLAEMERLDWSVAWHLDNVSQATRDRIAAWPRTIGWTESSDGPGRFMENARQGALDILQDSGVEWFVNHDADERWEPDAPAILEHLLGVRVLWKVQWLNVWGYADDGSMLIRVDPPFLRTRYRFHPVGPLRWEYRDPRTASPYVVGDVPIREVQTDLRLIHLGFSTPELRRRHFEFWGERVPNPFWKHLIDERSPVLLPFEKDLSYEKWLRKIQPG